MQDRTPYTYLIGWSSLDKWYYGVKTAKGCHPSTFWKQYFTSSKHVKKMIQQYGDPDIVDVRRVFDSVESAVVWEAKVLQRMQVVHDDRWLNLHDKVNFRRMTLPHSEQTKALIREIRSRQVMPPCSEEKKQKLRQANKGRKRHPDAIQKQKESLKDRPKHRHPRAKHIIVYNADGRVMFESKGDFRDQCAKHGVSHSILHRAYKNRQAVQPPNKTGKRANERSKVVGWYVVDAS